MKTIYKYNLLVQDYVEVDMPRGAEVLTVATQRDALCLWALVDTEQKETEIRTFRIIGTGHPFDLAHYRYISTFQIHGGMLIFHVFEILEK